MPKRKAKSINTFQYEGILNERIQHHWAPGLGPAESHRSNAEELALKRKEKFPALFDFHGVENGDWEGLAMALAQTHVAGFMVQGAVGRTTKWTEFDKAQFKIDVDQHIHRKRYEDGKNCSVPTAVKAVRIWPKWVEMTTKPKKLSDVACKNLYYSADERCVLLLAQVELKQAQEWDSNSISIAPPN
jgi:hypothetical protein